MGASVPPEVRCGSAIGTGESVGRARERGDRRRRGAARVVLAACLGVASRSSWGWAAAPSDRYRPPEGWRDPPEGSIEATAGDRGAGEAPHVVLIAFSGRCAITACAPPDENEDALSRTLVPAVADAWSAAGLRVEAWTHRAHLDDDPGRGRGYRSAHADREKAVQDGVLRPKASARLVVLGDSHGTQVAHLLAFEQPTAPFAASVLLDPICLGWDADHAAGPVAALAPGAGPWASAGPYRVGCDVLSIPGSVGRLDLGEVVPWNVARSLEVRTGGQVLGAVRDVRANVRPDGTRTGEVGEAMFDVWAGWVRALLAGAELRGRERTRCDKTTYQNLGTRTSIRAPAKCGAPPVNPRCRSRRGSRSSRC